jgi:hypothetical protein
MLRDRPRGRRNPVELRYQSRYHERMATFLLRLDDSELEALREAADAQGRSMNDLAREGLRAVTTGAAREEKVRGLTRRVMSDHAGLLKRLGEA